MHAHFSANDTSRDDLHLRHHLRSVHVSNHFVGCKQRMLEHDEHVRHIDRADNWSCGLQGLLLEIAEYLAPMHGGERSNAATVYLPDDVSLSNVAILLHQRRNG